MNASEDSEIEHIMNETYPDEVTGSLLFVQTQK